MSSESTDPSRFSSSRVADGAGGWHDVTLLEDRLHTKGVDLQRVRRRACTDIEVARSKERGVLVGWVHPEAFDVHGMTAGGSGTFEHDGHGGRRAAGCHGDRRPVERAFPLGGGGHLAPRRAFEGDAGEALEADS